MDKLTEELIDGYVYLIKKCKASINKPIKYYKKKIKKTRLTLCYKDSENVQVYVNDTQNSCNCGSNCYHLEYDNIDNKTYAVCNGCDTDLYSIRKEDFGSDLYIGKWMYK